MVGSTPPMKSITAWCPSVMLPYDQCLRKAPLAESQSGKGSQLYIQNEQLFNHFSSAAERRRVLPHLPVGVEARAGVRGGEVGGGAQRAVRLRGVAPARGAPPVGGDVCRAVGENHHAQEESRGRRRRRRHWLERENETTRRDTTLGVCSSAECSCSGAGGTRASLCRPVAVSVCALPVRLIVDPCHV